MSEELDRLFAEGWSGKGRWGRISRRTHEVTVFGPDVPRFLAWILNHYFSVTIAAALSFIVFVVLAFVNLPHISGWIWATAALPGGLYLLAYGIVYFLDLEQRVLGWPTISLDRSDAKGVITSLSRLREDGYERQLHAELFDTVIDLAAEGGNWG